MNRCFSMFHQAPQQHNKHHFTKQQHHRDLPTHFLRTCYCSHVVTPTPQPLPVFPSTFSSNVFPASSIVLSTTTNSMQQQKARLWLVIPLVLLLASQAHADAASKARARALAQRLRKEPQLGNTWPIYKWFQHRIDTEFAPIISTLDTQRQATLRGWLTADPMRTLWGNWAQVCAKGGEERV